MKSSFIKNTLPEGLDRTIYSYRIIWMMAAGLIFSTDILVKSLWSLTDSISLFLGLFTLLFGLVGYYQLKIKSRQFEVLPVVVALFLVIHAMVLYEVTKMNLMMSIGMLFSAAFLSYGIALGRRKEVVFINVLIPVGFLGLGTIDVLVVQSEPEFALKYWVMSLVSLILLINIVQSSGDKQLRDGVKQKLLNRIMLRLNKMIAHNIRGPVALLSMQMEIAELLKNYEVLKLKPGIDSLLVTLDSVLEIDLEDKTLTVGQMLDSLRKQYPRTLFITNRNEDRQVHFSAAVLFSIQNFISNAEKYTTGFVHVEFRDFEGYLVISIRDRGEGMTEEVLHKLGSPMSSSAGKGLGVSISLELLAFSGYTCAIESEHNMGTNVLLSLSKPAVLNSITVGSNYKIFDSTDSLIGLN